MQLEPGRLEKKLGQGCRGVPFAQAASTSRILEGLGVYRGLGEPRSVGVLRYRRFPYGVSGHI
jgi:hypothetical protein